MLRVRRDRGQERAAQTGLKSPNVRARDDHRRSNLAIEDRWLVVHFVGHQQTRANGTQKLSLGEETAQQMQVTRVDRASEP